MSEFASADIKRLSELLGDELETYGQIRKLTEEQTQLLAGDDIEGFNSSLEKREELIEKIKGLHQESGALMQSYVSSTASGKKKDSSIEKLSKQIRDLLQICAGLNNENIETMKKKTQEHIKKIDEKSAQRKGIGGYAQAIPNIPEMFDKKT